MIGVFVQTNTDSPKGNACPQGYVIQENGCWDWVGCKKDGYGWRTTFGTRDRRQVRAHRWFYEEKYGDIPNDKECHHVCANRACVNPDHLEILTHREHFDRDPAMQAGADRVFGAENRAKTHCLRGHPLSGDNLYLRRDRKNYRQCRECRCPGSSKHPMVERPNRRTVGIIQC